MAGKINYTVSMTPLEEIAAGDGYLAHDVMNTDINKTLTANASVAVQAGHSTIGYTTGVVTYISAIANGGAKTQLGADHTAYDFIYIKHTGYQYSSGTVLGNSTTDNLEVHIEYSAGSSWAHICSIPPGGAICLPNFPTQGASKGIFVESSGSDTVSTEYALVT